MKIKANKTSLIASDFFFSKTNENNTFEKMYSSFIRHLNDETLHEKIGKIIMKSQQKQTKYVQNQKSSTEWSF